MRYYHEGARDIPVVAETEILVAGAGPAGIGAAIAAARCGAKVMLVEKCGYLLFLKQIRHDIIKILINPGIPMNALFP